MVFSLLVNLSFCSGSGPSKVRSRKLRDHSFSACVCFSRRPKLNNTKTFRIHHLIAKHRRADPHHQRCEHRIACAHPLCDAAERQFTDLRRWTEMPHGGHFAAWEQPDALAAEVRAFFHDLY